VDANAIAQTTTVTFDDSKIQLADIIRAIRMERYEVIGEPKFIK
jgi:hypothetical protein